jgi:hypothetical protein
MTVRKNGADTGTLKTRMGFLIRDSAHHGTGGAGEGVAPRGAPSFRGDAKRRTRAKIQFNGIGGSQTYISLTPNSVVSALRFLWREALEETTN